MLSGRSPLDHSQRGAATENDKACKGCDDHGEPKHHRPRQSLLPRHGTTILSGVTGRRRAGLSHCAAGRARTECPGSPQAAAKVAIPAYGATVF